LTVVVVAGGTVAAVRGTVGGALAGVVTGEAGVVTGDPGVVVVVSATDGVAPPPIPGKIEPHFTTLVVSLGTMGIARRRGSRVALAGGALIE
jgi:hypothetical protein